MTSGAKRLASGPLISIVTPSFNSGDTIDDTIRSVQVQTYSHVEHIVVDGGSTDGTIDVLKRHPHLTWLSEHDEGQSDALNKGFRISSGEVVAWLNADDTYVSGEVLQEVMVLFRSEADAGLIHGDVEYLDASGDSLGRHRGREFSLADALLSNPINQQAAFFRRSVLESVGFLRTDLDYVMDYEFWLRIGAKCRSVYVPRVWATYCLRPGSKTVEYPERFWLEALGVFSEVFGSPQTDLELEGVDALANGRMHWLAGIGLYRTGAQESARGHCAIALNAYKLLETDQEFAVQACRYIESHHHREPYSPDWIDALVADLPAAIRQNGRFVSQVLGFFYATRADFHATRKAWAPVRDDTMRALRFDFFRWIGNRGFIRQGLRAIGIPVYRMARCLGQSG